MKPSLILLALLAPASALAQQNPNPNHVPPEFTLRITPDQLPLISDALMNLPKRFADPLLADFQSQINEQMAAQRKMDEQAAKRAESPKKNK